MLNSTANRILFLILFVIPLFAFSYYVLAIATDRYQSETSIIISQETSSGSSILGSALLGLPSSADDKDALGIIEFIMSREMLHYLEDKLHLRDHYTSSRVDWWDRLPNTASFEKFHDYMVNWLIVTYDPSSKIIRLQLQAFDEHFAKAVMEAILARSQEYIDDVNSEMTAAKTRFFEEKMVESEALLKEGKNALLTFQRANRLMTTESQSTLIIKNISGLERLLVQQKSEIDMLSHTLNADAPRLQELKQSIASLQNQISLEKKRLTGGSTSSISELDAQERDIQLNLEFVIARYQLNVSQLEQARVEAARRVKFLLTVTSPSLADEAQYPQRLYTIILAAIILLAIYFIVALSLSVIREHA